MSDSAASTPEPRLGDKVPPSSFAFGAIGESAAPSPAPEPHWADLIAGDVLDLWWAECRPDIEVGTYGVHEVPRHLLLRLIALLRPIEPEPPVGLGEWGRCACTEGETCDLCASISLGEADTTLSEPGYEIRLDTATGNLSTRSATVPVSEPVDLTALVEAQVKSRSPLGMSEYDSINGNHLYHARKSALLALAERAYQLGKDSR